MALPREKRPLLIGLVAAIGALAFMFRWPPTPAGNAAWALLIVVAATSMILYERSLAQLGRPSRMLRWVCIVLIVVAPILAWISSRSAILASG
ncbi:MAG TPA: hypothetical protein VJR92_13275 [Gemmatimonadaceae bacterium]|nr:hypothetical protein [Gemmatimonadaceae bacterium]